MLKILLQKHTPICSHENTVVKPTRLDLKEPLQILFFLFIIAQCLFITLGLQHPTEGLHWSNPLVSFREASIKMQKYSAIPEMFVIYHKLWQQRMFQPQVTAATVFVHYLEILLKLCSNTAAGSWTRTQLCFLTS